MTTYHARKSAAAKHVATWLTTLLFVLSPCLGNGDTAQDEYEVKAAMLLNIARYVTWPESGARKPSDPVTIGVLASPVVVRQIETALADKKIGSRPIKVRLIKSVAICTDCDIAFTTGTEFASTSRDFAALSTKAVLTVGDTEGFALQGGIIGLTIKDRRLHIAVNLKAAQRSGLVISSRILRLANVVGEVAW